MCLFPFFFFVCAGNKGYFLSKDQVFLGVFIGALFGWFLPILGVFESMTSDHYTGLAFSHLMKFSHRHGFIDRESYVAQYLSLAIFITGIVSTLGSDELLAAFAAGSALLPNSST